MSTRLREPRAPQVNAYYIIYEIYEHLLTQDEWMKFVPEWVRDRVAVTA